MTTKSLKLSPVKYGNSKSQYGKEHLARGILSSIIISIIILLVFSLLSGCGSVPKSSPETELKKIVQHGSKVNTKVRDISIRVHKDGFFTYNNTLQLDNPDTGSAQSVYIPLFYSEKPLTISGSPSMTIMYMEKCDTDSSFCDSEREKYDTSLDAGIMSIKTKSGRYFYVAGFSKEDMNNVVLRDRLYSPGDPVEIYISCSIENPDGQGPLKLLMGNTNQKTKINISIDSMSKLDQTKISAEGVQDGKLVEDFSDINNDLKKYSYTGLIEPGAILPIKLATHKPRGLLYYFFNWLAWLLSAMIFVAGFELVMHQRLLAKFRKYASPVQEPERNKYSRYSRFEQQQFSEEFSNKEKLYLRSRLRKWIIPFILSVLLTLLFLLIGTRGFGQDKSVIHNLDMGFRMSFDDKGLLQMNVDLEYKVCDLDVKGRKKSSYVQFDGKSNRIDFSQIKYEPIKLKCKSESDFTDNKVCLLNSNVDFRKQHEMDMLMNPAIKTDEVTFSANEPEKKRCHVNIPFIKFETHKDEKYKSLFGLRFYKFPFDKQTIEIPIRFEQYVLLRGISVERVKKFTGKPEINIPELDYFDDGREHKYSATIPSQIGAGDPIIITVVLQRGKTVRFLLPFLLLIGIVISLFAAFKPANKWLKAGGSLLAHATLLGFYKLVTQEVFSDVPSLLQLDDAINWYDIFFVISFIASLVVTAFSPERKG